MTATVAVAAGLGMFSLLERRGRRVAAFGAVGATLLVVMPPAGLAMLAVAGVARLRHRLRSRRIAGETAETDVGLLADLVALGLRAGLSLRQAFDRAAPELAPELGAEVRNVVAATDERGTSAALAESTGRAERLYRIAARAAATGAPLADAVEAFAAERRHADHARAVEAARRLPVRMLLPLALLILPGFVILAVGPALLEALERLQLAP